MKKLPFLITCNFLLLSLFFAFNNYQSPKILNTSSTSKLVMCATNTKLAIANAKLFDLNDYNQPAVAVMVRKNIASFTPAEITSLKAGITAMKALPVTNKTSWTYQAAIHGTTLAGANPSWNSCQHGTPFFLSWHRMYLYFFERILRAKSGSPTLTLPYWDYQLSGAIPSAYRTPTVGNSLYHASRSASMNSGATLPLSISTNINNALNLTSYMPFQSSLEGPHGAVHVSIGGGGGDMGAVNRAALDPVFWLHHTNIDRLWEAWLRKCAGRANPTTNATWMNQVFTFFDETGNAVNMTGTQVVNTAASLNYRYDFPFMLPCNFVWADIIWREARVFQLPNPPPIEKRLDLSFANAIELEPFKQERDIPFKFKNSETEVSDQVVLEFANHKISELPEGVIEVYVNLPAAERPTAKSKSFASVIDLFSAAGHSDHNNMPMRVDITEAVKNLGIKPDGLNKIKVSFIVRGNTLNGKDIETRASVRASDITLIIRRASKAG